MSEPEPVPASDDELSDRLIGISDPDLPIYRIYSLWFLEEALRLRQLAGQRDNLGTPLLPRMPSPVLKSACSVWVALRIGKPWFHGLCVQPRCCDTYKVMVAISIAGH